METTRSFFQKFRGYLTLAIVGTIGFTFQSIYTALVWKRMGSTFLVVAIAAYFIYSFYAGLRERDFRDWNKVELSGNTLTATKPFKKNAGAIDLSAYVYWAKVWIPKERGQAMPILVLSNHPFKLPEDNERLFRTVMDRETQVLVADAPEDPAEWFPNAKLVPVTQVNGKPVML